MAKFRVTLALAAWLFAWACWSFAMAQLLGGHAVRGSVSSLTIELAQNHDAVYVAAHRFAPTEPSLRYVRGGDDPEYWPYLMHGNARHGWPPNWSGFTWCVRPQITALRIPWWFVLAATGLTLAAMIKMAQRLQAAHDARADDAAATTGAPRTLSYALPDMSGRLERRLRGITVACSAICILITIAGALIGRRQSREWVDLVQVLAAMAATLGAANLLASPGFRGRRRRVIMLAIACFVALLLRLLPLQLH
jgi:hypothetical protein